MDWYLEIDSIHNDAITYKIFSANKYLRGILTANYDNSLSIDFWESTNPIRPRDMIEATNIIDQYLNPHSHEWYKHHPNFASF